MSVSKETALALAYAHREVETAEKMLAEVEEAVRRDMSPDIRDAFGRQQELQLGVPSGSNGHRLFNLQWSLASPIIAAHIAQQKALIAALSEKARVEITGAAP